MSAWQSMPIEQRHAALMAIADTAQGLRGLGQDTTAEALLEGLLLLQQASDKPGERVNEQPTVRGYALALPAGTSSKGRAKALAVARVVYMAGNRGVSTATVVESLRSRDDWQELFGHARYPRHAILWWLRKAVAAGYVVESEGYSWKTWTWAGGAG